MITSLKTRLGYVHGSVTVTWDPSFFPSLVNCFIVTVVMTSHPQEVTPVGVLTTMEREDFLWHRQKCPREVVEASVYFLPFLDPTLTGLGGKIPEHLTAV